MFELPDYVLYVLKKLSSRGFEAYIVGGCVRDIMLQKIPSDFDITTNALPFEIKECFEEHKIIDIGEKHGTVTIIIDSRKIEITTYRIDGTYSNNRHPDKVTFSCNLYDDLKRRDFTINAMAMKSSGELTDNFNGRSDLKNKIIRSVGDPVKRFTEDALRILRALRFASQLGFHIENKTSEMIHQYAYLIKNISAERIREEFVKILLGNSAEKILRENEIFEANNSYQMREKMKQYLERMLAFFEEQNQNPNYYAVYQVKTYLQEHCSESADIEKLAAEVGLSPNYLRSLFKEATGKTILEYNTEMRLQRAAELLKNKKNKVREVSLAVGYENVSYFGVVFQKRFGVTPNEYRKMV